MKWLACLAVLALGVRAAEATVVVPDPPTVGDPATEFDPPDWNADYGVFHQQRPADGTPLSDPQSDFAPFHNAGILGADMTIGVISETGSATDPANMAIQSLIQTIAPQAEVQFQSGFDQGQTTSNGRPTRANISAAIQAHRDNGVDIIVDGASYLTEPFFTNNSFSSSVGQAVQDARDDGIAYFAAAGDLNQNVYQSQWNDLGEKLGAGGHIIHNFNDNNSPDDDITLSLKVQPGETASFALQWQSTEGVFPNLDLAMFVNEDFSSPAEFSERNQREQGDEDDDGVADAEPWEIITWTNDTGSPADIDLAIFDDPDTDENRADALETAFKLLWVQADRNDSAEVGTFEAPTIYGHGLEAILIGSMDSQNARSVFAGGSASADETSSHLPAGLSALPFFIAPDNWSEGQPLQLLQELELQNGGEALDGTVISAAWTGALAALMKEQADNLGVQLSDQMLIQALTQAAIDIEQAGYDLGSGHGLIDPEGAFNAVDAIPEPASAALLLAGTGLALTRRRRR